MRYRKKGQALLCLVLSLILSSCSGGSKDKDYPSKYKVSEAQAIDAIKMPSHPSINTFSDGSVAMVDFSNATQGYIQARLLGKTSKRVKIKIMKDDKKYYYDLSSQEYETFPLQMGDGSYFVSIMQNIEKDMYANLISQSMEVQTENNNICYLYPNQMVNYHLDASVIKLSFDLVKKDKDDLTRIYHLYDYVIKNLKYDDSKAKQADDKYILPNLEEVLKSKKGICFDYASLLAALCRIQNIPAKVIVGDTDIEYHAWVEIYLEGEGWINPTVYFKEQDWSLIDPTFAATKTEYEGKYSEVYHY